ncbi:hypothetical protein JYK22_41185, partial [Nonomuraea sp. RK-328]|nr:hypothetical protein [Nonomuraea sp. RK-328]
MRIVYKVLAYLIAVEVAVQAAVMVYGDAGLGKWIEQGGVLDKTVMESEASPFPEVIGLMTHGINGMMVIPVIALLLLIASFFARVPGAVKAAGLVLLLVVLQVTLGLFGHDIPALGALHGINALLLFSAALYAARRDRSSVSVPAQAEPRLGTAG